jgi:hypothetical protein
VTSRDVTYATFFENISKFKRHMPFKMCGIKQKMWVSGQLHAQAALPLWKEPLVSIG